MFSTYVNCPPAGVEFDLPKPIKRGRTISFMYEVYNKLGDYTPVRWLISSIIDPLIFGTNVSKAAENEADLLHFINMVPGQETNKPYIIEFEHVGALTGFTVSGSVAQKVRRRLLNSSCKAVICSSYAAKSTLERFLEKDFTNIKNKVHVIYPAVCKKDIRQSELGHSNLDAPLKLLFVGNLCYRKGLEEILLALEKTGSKREHFKLDIISNDAKKLVNDHPELSGIISLYEPKYSKEEILDKFYSQADVFVLPTKGDTFGFALVDALTCGVPVISTRQFAIPEIITDKEDGILLDLSDSPLDFTALVTRKMTKISNSSNPDSQLVDQLTNCLENLLTGKYNLHQLGKNAIRKVQSGGILSIDVRNKSLLNIYRRALN